MKIRKILVALICITIILAAGIWNKKIINYVSPIFQNNPKVIIPARNEYYRNYDFKFVQNTDNFIPYGYQDLLNIIYTILNNGWKELTFYCPEEYEECTKDLEKISLDNILLTNINNYVHPYNNFTNIKTTYDNTGEITIVITKLYNDDKITTIENKVNEIMSSIIEDNMTLEEKINKIHNYIIDHTSYDIVKNETGISKYDANTAYGTLIEGHSVCGGYSDAMAIFLNKLNVKNFKMASSDHVWNAVFTNNKWLHLDLTWDDPVSQSGEEYLLQKYFLIDDDTLKGLDNESHNYNLLIYQEFK